MSRKRATHEEYMQVLTYNIIYNNLKNIALNLFEWDGLPNRMKPEYMENTLYNHGQAIFVNDKNLGFICLPVTPSTQVNVYGEHLYYRANGIAYNEEFSIDDCVIILNNKLRTPTHDLIEYYAQKLVNIEMSLDSNVSIQKFPFIIKCDDKNKLTFMNIFNQIQTNTPAIYVDKNIDLSNLEILDTNAPMVLAELSDYRHDVLNEALTRLGINNANTDKKERLVTDEVNANNEYIEMNSSYMLDTRKRACKEINEMYGLSISVKLKGGIDNGSVYTNNKGID
jgi:hypothetical protein